MMLAWTIVWSTMIYLFAVGVTYHAVLKYLDNSELIPWIVFTALVWPLTIPVALGMYVARAPGRWEVAAKEKARKMMEAVAAAEARTKEMERECEIVDPLVALEPKPEPARTLVGRLARDGYPSMEDLRGPVPDLPSSSPYSRGGMPRHGAGLTRRL